MGSAFDVIGLIGSLIISAALVPQVSKVYRTKSANDISYPFVCMYITGLSLIAIYGIGEGLWPIYIPSTMELLGAIALLSMKIRYANTKTESSWRLAESPKAPEPEQIAIVSKP